MTPREETGPKLTTAAPPAAKGPVVPPPPRVDMAASREMRQWIARLQRQQQAIGTRNRYLAGVLAAAILAMVAILGAVYHATIGTYAVLDGLQISHDPAQQGKVWFRFRVEAPGKVYYRRTAGRISTDLIDYFHAPGDVERSWSWTYEPGSDIEVTLWSRRGLVRSAQREAFSTFHRADIVFLVDTTGSMSRSIAELKEKCVAFSERLANQAFQHRFALIGFGDARQGDWLDKHGFTADVAELRKAVEGIQRFDGGDLPESSLDALEEALSLPFDAEAIRLFYLVTDAPPHDPAQSGATAARIAQRLHDHRVVLHVFSRREYRGDYAGLLARGGRFQPIESFGKTLQEGRVLED